MRRARFNHPSHGAALSHVVVMIAQKNTRKRRLFQKRKKKRWKEEYRQRKRDTFDYVNNVSTAETTKSAAVRGDYRFNDTVSAFAQYEGER